MSDLLSIGASGVRAYQAALTTVSENIANAGNAAYARRTTALTEIAAPGGAAVSLAGNGVIASATQRAADGYKSAAVRQAGTDLAKTEAGAAWLERIQSALTGNQLGAQVTSFFGAAQSLAADPSSTASRAVMLEAGRSVASAFSNTGAALDQVAADLDTSGTQGAATLTALATALAKVNGGLGRAAPGSASAASLADQRDQLLEQMSAVSDVAVTLDAAGRATVRAGSATLVQGDRAGSVGFARNEEGAVAFSVQFDGETSALTPTGGAMAGLAEGAKQVADARAALDALATDFAAGVNAVQAQGRDANGQPGAAMFAAGASPTELSLAIGDGSAIAAAAVGGGARDNGNLVRLAGLRTSGAFENRFTALVASNGAAIESRRTVAAAQAAIRDGAVASLSAATGVDLDTEAVELLRFQQAYQASSRVIQVARETLQSLLEIR